MIALNLLKVILPERQSRYSMGGKIIKEQPENVAIS
jgi:hypothetical protein